MVRLKSSIPAPGPDGKPEVGGILQLQDALERFPGKGIVIYNRVSSYGQAGKGKWGLYEKTTAVVEMVIAIAPDRERFDFEGIEEGKLTGRRKVLCAAAEHAEQHGLILVASDLSRFIRSEDYNRRTNPGARPTRDEFARLQEMTRGVPLATIADPSIEEGERQSLATKRTGRAGRPRGISDELASRIVATLIMVGFDPQTGKWKWRKPVREVASEFKVSLASLYRLLEREAPSGGTWLDHAIRNSMILGHLQAEDK